MSYLQLYACFQDTGKELYAIIETSLTGDTQKAYLSLGAKHTFSSVFILV